MSHSHGTPSAVRQKCPVSLFGVSAVAVLALLFNGCIPSGWECLSSSDCEAGLTCVHWEEGLPEEMRYCAKPCPVEDEWCDTGERCDCPDSPAKWRCTDDDGKRIGVCTGTTSG